MRKFKKFIHGWAWSILVVFCIVGMMYPIIGVLALVCMIAPVITAFFNGRMWCGNFCPRGSFNDILLAKVSFRRKVPEFMTTLWFRNIFLVLLMGAFTIQLILAWGSMKAIGIVFVRMIILTTLLSILLGINYSQRTWCMICPMGTLAHYVAKMKTVMNKSEKVTFKLDKCVDCKLCNKSCPMGINVLGFKMSGKVLDTDCLKCNACVEKCPKKSLYMG